MKEKDDAINFDEIICGNFIHCGKPRIDDEGNIFDWIGSFVKMSEIKTIHEKLNDNIPQNKKYCIFYTYKDEWYICSMPCYLLCYTINSHFETNVNTHGSEICRDKSRSHSL